MNAIFVKDFGGWAGHPPVFRKNDVVRITHSTLNEKFHTIHNIEHLNGEACGYVIPDEYLEMIDELPTCDDEIERIIRVCMQREAMGSLTIGGRFNIAREARKAIMDRINGFGKEQWMPQE